MNKNFSQGASDLQTAQQAGIAVKGVAVGATAKAMSVTDGFVVAGVASEDFTLSAIGNSTTAATATIVVNALDPKYPPSVHVTMSYTGATSAVTEAYWCVVDSAGVQKTRNRPLYADTITDQGTAPTWECTVSGSSTTGWTAASGATVELRLVDPSLPADTMPLISDGWGIKLTFTHANESKSIVISGHLIYKRGL